MSALVVVNTIQVVRGVSACITKLKALTVLADLFIAPSPTSSTIHGP